MKKVLLQSIVLLLALYSTKAKAQDIQEPRDSIEMENVKTDSIEDARVMKEYGLRIYSKYPFSKNRTPYRRVPPTPIRQEVKPVLPKPKPIRRASYVC